MIEKMTVIDKIEIVKQLSWYVVQVRQKTYYVEDGVQTEANVERWSIDPNSDWTNENQLIQDVCDLVHTQECIDAFLLHINPPEVVPEDNE